MTGLLGQQSSVNDPNPEHVKAFLAKRDLSVDLVRVTCVMLVVVIHTLLLGVSTTHGIQISRPGQQHAWFAYATWFLQIMPLFFVVGGFASWQGWASTQRKGGTWRDFYRVRILRLAYPAAVFFSTIAVLLWGAKLFGAPGDIINSIAAGLGFPLWFLAAYLWTQLLVPVLVHLHKTRPYLTIAGLFLLCVIVDAIRYSTGITDIGLLNMLWLWPLAQQIGFFYADGRLQRIPRWLLPIIASAAFGVVALLGETGPYSKDMLDNLNPPTTPLLFIGLAHIMLFCLFKPALDKLMSKRVMQGTVFFLGSRAMTIYLWHLLIVILVNALILVFPSLPQADTSAWWATRAPVILLEYGLIFALSLLVARFERGPKPAHIHGTPGTLATFVIAVCSILPPFYALQFQLDMPALLWGTALVWIAVLLAMGPHRRQKFNSLSSTPSNNSSASHASS